MKKLISGILSTIMFFSIFTIGVGAESATSGKCGENLTWSFNETAGVLTISGTGYMYDYLNAYDQYGDIPWNSIEDDFYIRSRIKKVVITEGVKNIACNSFSYCANLSEVELPDGLEEIEGRAFEDCYNLENIDIPDSVTTIGIFAFAGCGLKSVTLPESLTIIKDGLFSYSSLENISIPEGVTSIGYQSFAGCNFTEIEIPA